MRSLVELQERSRIPTTTEEPGAIMYAVAGAILINAACVLMASGHDSFDIYVGQRVLMMVGAAMVLKMIQNPRMAAPTSFCSW